MIAFAWVTAVHLATGTRPPRERAPHRPRRSRARRARGAAAFPPARGWRCRWRSHSRSPSPLGRALFPHALELGRADRVHRRAAAIAAGRTCCTRAGCGSPARSAGTAAATVLAGGSPPARASPSRRSSPYSAAAVLLRTLSYAYWAAGITAVLALLNGYFGVGGTDVARPATRGHPARRGDRRRRLLARPAGPHHRRAARRVADALAALGDVLAGRDPQARAHRVRRRARERSSRSRRRCALIRRARRRSTRCRPARAPVAALAAAARASRAAGHAARPRRLAREVGALRRAIAGTAHRTRRPRRPADNRATRSIVRWPSSARPSPARRRPARPASYTALRQKK